MQIFLALLVLFYQVHEVAVLDGTRWTSVVYAVILKATLYLIFTFETFEIKSKSKKINLNLIYSA